jgi:hypothetical protein
MKKHLIIRLGILVVGFLLIYIFDHWDSWFNDSGSIGGNSGMSVPIGYFLNLGWIFLWCLFLFIEILVTFFKTSVDKRKRGYNLILILLGIILFIVYNKIISS